MSLSTIAAARQKEMKASMAVVATSTRGAPDIRLCCDEVPKSIFIRELGRTARSSAFRSRFRSRCGGRLYTSPVNPAEHTAPKPQTSIYKIKKTYRENKDLF